MEKIKAVEKDKKETVLDGCFKLFLERKQGNVTVPELERVLGVTRGKFFYYYKNMEEITTLTVEHYFTKVEDYFSFFYQGEKTTLRDFIFQYVDNWKRFDQSIIEVTDNSGSSVIKFFLHATMLHPDFESKVKVLFDKEQKCWEEVLRKAIENKEIREDIDVPVTATKFYCINMGVLTQSYLIPNSFKASTLLMLFLSLYDDIKKKTEEKRNIFD